MKIYNIIGVIVLLFTLNACKDELDQTPFEKVGIDQVLSSTTIVNLADACYSDLASSFIKHSSGQLQEVFTDDVFRAGRNLVYDYHNGLLAPENPYFSTSIWKDCWAGIDKCNKAIKYLPITTVTRKLVTQESLDRMYDAAIILRSWYYFTLVTNFGPVPFFEEPLDVNEVDWESLTRPNYDDLITDIVSDIDEVIDRDVLPLKYSASKEFTNINMATAYALKSRILLYVASEFNNPTDDLTKWQDAADAAQECLDAITPEYQLISMAEYGRLFSDAADVATPGIILRSKVNGAPDMNINNGVDLAGYGSATRGNNCGAVPTQELVDCFELTNGTMPVLSYNADHTSVTLSTGYSEDQGDNPYANRDARLKHAILFNGAGYGSYSGQVGSLTIYTYENNKYGTGFNSNPLSQEDADKRRSCTGYYGKKFRTAEFWGNKQGGGKAHKIYFRLAEIYLNLAEAQCELGNYDEAEAALDVVRERALQPKVTDIPGYVRANLMNKIRNERRVEFCFEGHRYHDQRRWNILAETNGAITGMKITSTGGDDGSFSYQRVKINVPRNATSDKYLALPISLEEVRKIPGIGQHPVWR